MPQVVVDLDDGRGSLPVEEVLEGAPNDLHYFVAAAEAAAPFVDGVHRFVISYSPSTAHLLTPRDVCLFVGDETATPLPGRPVCPVFRTYGERFGIPRRGLSADPVLTITEIAQWARNAMRAGLRNWPDTFPLRGPRPPAWLPLGMPAFQIVPPSVPQIVERPIEVGFRGSVGGGKRYAPKSVSRRRMLSELTRMSRDLVVDCAEIESFGASYSRDPSDYVEALLGTKICLAPRGGSTETYRVFEGAMAGCVLITEPLPPAWFYAGLPRIELCSWSQLPEAVDALRSHPPLMESMSRAGRDWAVNVISPEAIGAWIARCVDALHR
jgi:hypothetical protein